jgi:hypothetical protein
MEANLGESMGATLDVGMGAMRKFDLLKDGSYERWEQLEDGSYERIGAMRGLEL